MSNGTRSPLSVRFLGLLNKCDLGKVSFLTVLSLFLFSHVLSCLLHFSRACCTLLMSSLVSFFQHFFPVIAITQRAYNYSCQQYWDNYDQDILPVGYGKKNKMIKTKKHKNYSPLVKTWQVRPRRQYPFSKALSDVQIPGFAPFWIALRSLVCSGW